MKSFLLNTLKIVGIVLVCFMNPIAGLTLSQQLADNDDDSDYEF